MSQSRDSEKIKKLIVVTQKHYEELMGGKKNKYKPDQVESKFLEILTAKKLSFDQKLIQFNELLFDILREKEQNNDEIEENIIQHNTPRFSTPNNLKRKSLSFIETPEKFKNKELKIDSIFLKKTPAKRFFDDEGRLTDMFNAHKLRRSRRIDKKSPEKPKEVLKGVEIPKEVQRLKSYLTSPRKSRNFERQNFEMWKNFETISKK